MYLSNWWCQCRAKGRKTLFAPVTSLKGQPVVALDSIPSSAPRPDSFGKYPIPPCGWSASVYKEPHRPGRCRIPNQEESRPAFSNHFPEYTWKVIQRQSRASSSPMHGRLHRNLELICHSIGRWSPRRRTEHSSSVSRTRRHISHRAKSARRN